MTSQVIKRQSLSPNLNQNQTQLTEINDQSSNRTHSSTGVVTASYSLKITFLGDSSVGKTSLITKYCQDKFIPEGTNPTINVGILEKSIKIDSFTEVKFSIWDTAGAEKYISFTKGYLRESNGVIIVFDFSNEKSFENLNLWMDLIDEGIGGEKIEKILVGNKSDLPDNEKKISDDMAKKFAGEHGMKFISVSAKEGINIDYLFEVLGNDCVKKMKDKNEKEENQIKEIDEKVNLNNDNNNNYIKNNKKKKGKCC